MGGCETREKATFVGRGWANPTHSRCPPLDGDVQGGRPPVAHGMQAPISSDPLRWLSLNEARFGIHHGTLPCLAGRAGDTVAWLCVHVCSFVRINKIGPNKQNNLHACEDGTRLLPEGSEKKIFSWGCAVGNARCASSLVGGCSVWAGSRCLSFVRPRVAGRAR